MLAQRKPPHRSGAAAKGYYLREKPPCLRKTVFGGGWWIRTTEGVASRFTVCPLWPLGKSPMYEIGAGGRIRTPDLLITNQLLYQLSYTSISLTLIYNNTLYSVCQHFFQKNLIFLKNFLRLLFPLKLSQFAILKKLWIIPLSEYFINSNRN